MGGIIAVDFIDMGQVQNRRKLTEAMRKAMKPDKAKHNVLSPSRFGVVEITRQRVREVTDIKTAEQCPSCNGTGKVEASILVTDRIEDALKAAADRGLGEVTLSIHPMVEAYITRRVLEQPGQAVEEGLRHEDHGRGQLLHGAASIQTSTIPPARRSPSDNDVRTGRQFLGDTPGNAAPPERSGRSGSNGPMPRPHREQTHP